MIKVLNKKEEQKVYRQTCYECGAELEYTIDDTYIGALGSRYITCPNCNKKIANESIEGIDLNSKNIKFPEHFFEPGGVDIDNAQINEWIHKCLKAAEESEEPYGYFITTGSWNTKVILLAYGDEYEIIVTKDYYETSIVRQNN